MKVTREDLQNTYSSKTDQELVLMDESKLTDLAREVLQEIKRERNISQEYIVSTVINNRNEKIVTRTIQRDKNIYNIKKFILYIYVIILLAAIKPTLIHLERGVIIAPFILYFPILVYIIFKIYQKNRG